MHIRNVNTSFFGGLLAAGVLAILGASDAMAQNQSNPLFSPGSILVSRSTYIGTATTVPFPGTLPNNAASTANGLFPNVFNNETPDGSFGVTSPIFIDQLSTGGGLIGTIPVTSLVSSQLSLDVATSFPSKSELGLSLTPSGTGVTFMAYGAASNLLDISNSNTPGHVDITNPVNGKGVLLGQRDIIELNANGNVLVTATNGYSGNNGRNTVLASNNNYYTVGNAGNNGSSVTLAAGTVSFAGSSVTLSGASTTANIFVGTPFTGTGIAAATYVTAIADSTHMTISTPGPASPSGAYVANAGAIQLTGVSFASGSTTITVADTSKLVPGMPLTGTGLVTGAYTLTVTDATHFTINTPTSAASDSGSYIASVSNSMLSDNTGVRMIAKGSRDTAGTGTGILDAANNSLVVGKVNGVFGTTPGYQHGFAVTQLGMTFTGSTSSGSPTVTGLNPTIASVLANNIQLYSGLPFTGTGIPSSTTIVSVDTVANTITLSKNATATGASSNLVAAPAADKSGKDDNFRGVANYNNTLYITKGSGGNGLDAVYQVNPLGGGYVSPGASAGLPTAATAAAANINPLPGWPTGSTGANEGKANGTTVHHPFGVWFANDTTLYVADEGLTGSSASNAAPGGVEKWMFNSATGNWELKYTLAASTIPGYNVAGIGNLQANGLRNISGVNNYNGTVTIFGITSTTGQTLNDEGADPNQLVSITDTLAATALPAESFVVLETAAYQDVLRGVAFIPGLAVTRGGLIRDRRTGLYTQQVTIQNLSSAAISGPVYLVIDSLSSNATFTNATGTTANNPPASPYVLLPGTSGGLALGASASVTLQFADPTNGNITYDTRVLNGPSLI
jgi:hypothetical protein